jgi:hypothetical protein
VPVFPDPLAGAIIEFLTTTTSGEFGSQLAFQDMGLTSSPIECPTPPRPPAIDIGQNIATAQDFARSARAAAENANKMGEPADAEMGIALWFANQVRPGGEWDYKSQGGSEWERFGNFHFGVIGAALGYSLEALQRAAGLVQNGTDLVTALSGGTPSGTGHFVGSPPYGDDPRDQSQIADGTSAFILSQQGICVW